MYNSKNVSLEELAPFEVKSFNLNQLPVDDISSYSLKQTYINSRECPHCSSHHVQSYGNYKGRKRYLCQNCGKSYNDLTNTPFSGIHDLKKIMKYLNCMISGDTVRKAAEVVNISVTTSFSWRHKLLNGLRELPSPNMKNVKEMMELELPYSHKGQRTMPSQTEKITKISALFVCDRTGKMDSDSIPLTLRDSNPLFARISKISNEHTDLICPTKFLNFIDSSQINLKTTTSSYTQPRLINQIITLWQTWMKRFHGVASKYLSNYLHWFDYLDNSLFNPDKISGLIQLLLKH